MCSAPPTLYYLDASAPCRAVLLTAKVLDIPLNLREVDLFGKKEHRQEWFLKMNPAHTVPTLQHGSDFFLWESRAIMCYLVEKYGEDLKSILYVKNLKDRAVVNQMLNFDMGSLSPGIVGCLHDILFRKMEPSQEKLDKVKEKLAVLDEILKRSPFAAGKQLTVADLSLIMSVTTLDCMGIDYGEFKNISQWVKKVKAEIPEYEEVNRKGESDLMALIQSKKAEMK